MGIPVRIMKFFPYGKSSLVFPYAKLYIHRDCRMQMRIPVCIQAGIAKIFAYRDPPLHNEIVRIRGVTSPQTRRCARWFGD
jgi:hypothetical protein